MSKKYAALGDFLDTLPQGPISISFERIEQILNCKLPRSAHDYDEWWSNSAAAGRHNSVWLKRGWETAELNRKGKSVQFRRARPEQGIARSNAKRFRSDAIIPTPLPSISPVVAEAVDITLEFEWIYLGRVSLDPTGRLCFPAVVDRPAVYRLRVVQNAGSAIYIGESGSLRRRLKNYRIGSIGQSTSHRIHVILREVLSKGGSVSVDAVVNEIRLKVKGATVVVDLESRSMRCMIEQAAIVAMSESDIEIINK